MKGDDTIGIGVHVYELTKHIIIRELHCTTTLEKSFVWQEVVKVKVQARWRSQHPKIIPVNKIGFENLYRRKKNCYVEKAGLLVKPVLQQAGI